MEKNTQEIKWSKQYQYRPEIEMGTWSYTLLVPNAYILEEYLRLCLERIKKRDKDPDRLGYNTNLNI